MYQDTVKAQFASGQLGLVGAGQMLDVQPPTIRQNIDRQIEVHKAAIARLEETRGNLEKANLLDMKISDLREAMSY